MRVFRSTFLIALILLTPGFRFRCIWLCSDQTSTQNDYDEQRDRCRDYAQLKLDLALKETPGPIDDKTKKAKLVSLFSDCMGNNGWNVPSGKDDAPKPPVPPGGVPAGVAAAAGTGGGTPAAPDPYRQKAALSRTAECDFARQAKENSTLAAARAQACDLECAERMRAAPEAPRPAACPANTVPKLSTGSERD